MAPGYLWALSAASATPPGETRSCFCVGPQNGDPVCPCRMPAYRQEQHDRADAEAYRRAVRENRILPPPDDPDPSPIGLEDDAEALASAGMVEEP